MILFIRKNAKALFFTLASTLLLFSAHGQGLVAKKAAALREGKTPFQTVEPFESAVAADAKNFDDLDIAPDVLREAAVLVPAPGSLVAISDEAPEHLALVLPTPHAKQETATLDLYRSSIFAPDFKVVWSDNPGEAAPHPDAVFYRGAVRGYPQSLAAIAIIDGEMSGMIALDGETFVIGPARQATDNEHVLFRKNALEFDEDFICTALESESYEIPEKDAVDAPKTDNCVRVRLEIDNGLTTSLGGPMAATNYATALYNQVIVLFANDGIDVTVSEIYVWTDSSPYSGGLNQRLYQMNNASPNADLTQLITNAVSGGIAWLSGLCSSGYGTSVAGVYGYFNNVPSYSWDVNVATHELGHNLSSPHTHACAWNGNNTAIDGCGSAIGYSEGCSGTIPSGGGTIMSYCHLTWAGVNFNLGLGPQPANRIRNYINSRPCLSGDCGGGGPAPCLANSYDLQINFDNFPAETSWQITDENGQILASGENYGTSSTVTETLCLSDGCHTLTFFDSDGDGMCCTKGNGGFQLIDNSGNAVVSGGDFSDTQSFEFCTPDGSPNCDFIDFNDYEIKSYAGNRDIGSYTILNGGSALYLHNNAMKYIDIDYEVTANTVVELEFSSSQITQLHAIGFDHNKAISLNLAFKLYGTANANKVNNQYGTYAPSGYKQFHIPVGQHYHHPALDRLFFLVGRTTAPGQGNGYFKNVRIYEAGQCTPKMSTVQLAGDVATSDEFVLYPNPSSGNVNLVSHGGTDIGLVRVFDSSGSLVEEREVYAPEAAFDLSDRAPGLYLFTWVDAHGDTHQKRVAIGK